MMQQGVGTEGCSAEDAVLYFRNDTKTWTEDEIQQVDTGLRLLHLRTGNDQLLETSKDGTVTFVRSKAYPGKPNVIRENDSGGNITLYDGAFSSPTYAIVTAVHEVGHNWDREQSQWQQWLACSGWRNTKPPVSQASNYVSTTRYSETWWYLKDKVFALDYGKAHPLEDWSTAWESYFTFKNNFSNPLQLRQLPADKLAHVDRFFNSLA